MHIKRGSHAHIKAVLCFLSALALAGCAASAKLVEKREVDLKPGHPPVEGSVSSDRMPSPIDPSTIQVDAGNILLGEVMTDLEQDKTVEPAEAARLLELRPQDARSWYAAGLVSYRAGDHAAAMVRLKRSAALDPVNPATLMTLGETALKTGDLSMADRYFSLAYEASPTPASANRLALLRMDGGYLESARDVLFDTLEKNPADLMSRNNLAVAMDMMGDTAAGISILVERETNDPRLLHTQALLQLKEGRPDQAVQGLDAGGDQSGQDHHWLLLGIADLQRGQLEEAEGKFRTAIEARPSEHEGYLNLGLALRRQGKFTEAEKTYKEGLDRSSHPDLHLNLGVLYELYRGEHSLALQQYRQYLEQEGPAADRVRGWVEYLDGVVEIQESGAGSQ